MGIADIGLAAQLELVGLTAWAMALGGLVGWERQLVSKPAGLRTHMLVAGAAALLTGVTADLSLLASNGDPTRGIHAIITGIGFIGGGTILRQRDEMPSGLTTAATVMYTAVLGAAVTVGYGLSASVATVLAILVLRVFGRGRREPEGSPARAAGTAGGE